MAITFAVDDVVPAAAPARTVPLGEVVGSHAVLALDAGLPVVPVGSLHPLLAAVQRAFDEHRPLVLSPDAIWLTIAGGVANHVRLHAETLRPMFVRHAGKKELEVELAAVPHGAAAWTELIGEFRRRLAEELGAGRARLFACDFSTSGETERIAGEIALMDVFAPYYAYVGGIICGIPEITLTGTVDDWRSIRARVDVLAELGLEFWTASLAPILDRLIDAAAGRPDRAFFQAIYKPQAAYGRDTCTGWIGRLFPYVRGEHERFDERNPLLAHGLDAALPPPGPSGFYDGPGLIPDHAPPGPSRVVVTFRCRAAGWTMDVEVAGGLLAVEQDERGRLVPRAGWLVRDADRGQHALAARIRREHRVVRTGASPHGLDDIVEAILFEHTAPWRLVPDGGTPIQLGPGWDRDAQLQLAAELPDGWLLATFNGLVVRLRREQLGALTTPPFPVVDPVTALPLEVRPPPYLPTSVPLDRLEVVGGSMVEVIERALAAGGRVPEPNGRSVLDGCEWLIDTELHALPLLERLREPGHVVEPADGEPFPARDFLSAVRLVEITIGSARWRIPPRPERLRVALGGRWVDLTVDLGDGTVLARVRGPRWPRVVRLRRDQLAEEVLDASTRRRVPLRGWRSSQPLTDIPVLGRSLVEVLTHALDTGELPAASTSYEAAVREDEAALAALDPDR